MKENSLLRYRVNLKVSQTMLKHNQNLFLIVFLLLRLLALASLQKFLSSSFAYSAARALSLFSIDHFTVVCSVTWPFTDLTAFVV